jgi:hypothetical protein
MLYKEIIAVCSQIHTKHINTLCGQNVEVLNVKPGGTYSNDWALGGYISVIKTNQLMLYKEIIAVCSQIHTKHVNTLCGQNVTRRYIKQPDSVAVVGLEWHITNSPVTLQNRPSHTAVLPTSQAGHALTQ